MKMKPVSRAGQNGSAAAPARQTQKRAGERSRKLTRGEFVLLNEINIMEGAVSLSDVREIVACKRRELEQYGRAGALLRRDPATWAKYYALGGKRMINDENARPAAAGSWKDRKHLFDALTEDARRDGFQKCQHLGVLAELWKGPQGRLNYIGPVEATGPDVGQPYKFLRRPVSREWAFNLVAVHYISAELWPELRQRPDPKAAAVLP